MPTTALNVLLPGFARFIGAYIGTFSTTTNIAADTNVISTGLRSAGFTNDDVLNDTFIRILGTTNSGVVRRVNDYTGASGTVVVSGTNLTAEVASRDFELYRYDPTQIVDYLNDARLTAFPSVHRVIYDRSLTTAAGQKLYARPTTIQPFAVRQIWLEERINAKTFANNICQTLDVDMEASGTANWTASNVTISKEAETTAPDNFMVYAGSQSLKCVVALNQTATVFMAVPSPTNYDGEEINVGIWVYSRTASRVSAAVRFDSGSVTTGTAHSGGGWEYLTVSLSVGDVTSTIDVGVQISSGVAFTFYADELIATAGPSEQPRGPENVVYAWEEQGDNIRINQPVSGDRNFLVAGHGLLSSVSAGTDTIEINGDQLYVLYVCAAELFFQGDIDQLSEADLNAAQRRWKHYANRVERGFGQMAPLPLVRRVI